MVRLRGQGPVRHHERGYLHRPGPRRKTRLHHPQGLKGERGAPTGAISFDKPSTRDVLFCDGTLAAPNDGTRGPVAAVLGAALNRSTLTSHTAQPTTDPATFYGERLTNHYAKAMHAATKDGRAYGFAFDDVAGFASYIEDPAPKELTLTLTPF